MDPPTDALPAPSSIPLSVRFPLPRNVDPDFIVPIWDRNNNPGLPFSAVMSCWESFWARLDVQQGGLRGAVHNHEGQDIRQVVSAAIHAEHSSPMSWTLPDNGPIFVDCCPMPGELWGVHGQVIRGSLTATDLVALIVPAMFKWYSHLRAHIAVKERWESLSASPQWKEWLHSPNLNHICILSVRRTVHDHLRTRYFPEIAVYVS